MRVCTLRAAVIGCVIVTSTALPATVAPARATAHVQKHISGAARCPKRNQARGAITYSDGSTPGTLNPYALPGFGFAMFDDLFRYDPNGRTYPMMARELPTVRNGGVRDGGRTIVIHLKRGLRWSNGAEITSTDVRFGWRVDMDPNTGPLCAGYCDSVTSIGTPDRYTAVVHLKRPFPEVISAPAQNGNSWHVWPARWPNAWNGDPHAAALKLASDPSFNFLSPSYPTNGPYQVARVVSDHEVDLRPMPYYDDMTCGGYIKTIRDIGFDDGLSGMQTAATSGHLDIGVGYLPEQLGGLARVHRVYHVHAPPSFTFEHLELNLDRFYNGAPNPLANLSVRLALALALDRQRIGQDSLGLTAKDARPLVSWTPWVNSPALRQPYAESKIRGQWDPLARRYLSDTGHGQAMADARELLARGPWKRGFTVSFARSDRPYRQTIARDLARSWAPLGVKLTEQQASPRELFSTWADGGILAHGGFQVTSFAWIGGTDPDPMKTVLESRYIARDHPSRAADADQNYAGIRDRVIDREFERGESTTTHAVRVQAFHRVQERLNQQAYWVPLFYLPDVTTTTPRILGFRSNPVGGADAMYAYLWKTK
jgi:peptide/nickel transport system substrate-binding protein